MKKLPANQLDRISTCHSFGMSQRAIALEVGVSEDSVLSALGDPKPATKPSTLVGSCFHTFSATAVPFRAAGSIERQGHVLEALSVGYCFVEYFSFEDGHPTARSIVPFEDMLAWRFYHDVEEMKEAYENECHARDYAARHTPAPKPHTPPATVESTDDFGVIDWDAVDPATPGGTL